MKSFQEFIKLSFGILIFLSLAINCIAQDNQNFAKGDKVVIKTLEENEIRGTISEITDQFIKLETGSLGILQIALDQITSLEMILPKNAELDKNGIPIDFHNSTHYFISSSGFNLKKGQQYYQNIGIFFNSYSVGLSDEWDFSVGGEIVSLLFASRIPALFLSTKTTVSFSEKNNLGIGVSFLTLPQENFNGVGFLFSNYTIGDRNNNFSLGAGFGFTTEDFEDTPIFMAGGMTRLSKKISLVTDNWFIFLDGDVSGFLSLGLRIYTRGKVVVDVGLFRILEDTDELLALPFVGFSVPIK